MEQTRNWNDSICAGGELRKMKFSCKYKEHIHPWSLSLYGSGFGAAKGQELEGSVHIFPEKVAIDPHKNKLPWT